MEPLFVHVMAKDGTRKTFSVVGDAVPTLLDYMHRHLQQPAPFMFRHTTDPHLCMGAERIAKRCLHVMAAVGIDTGVFKSHSLRGAVATHLSRLGTPLELIKARGDGRAY
jgi:site-specific recombinase XerD